MERAVYTQGNPKPPFFVPVAGAGFHAFTSHGHSMAYRIALFCPWVVVPKDCRQIWDDQRASHATPQAMDLASNIIGSPL